MGLKRVQMRFSFAEELDTLEQDSFLDDRAAEIDGTDVGGQIVASGGWCWIDYEGPEAEVEEMVSLIQGDDRVYEYDLKLQEFPDDREMGIEWFAHHDGSAKITL